MQARLRCIDVTRHVLVKCSQVLLHAAQGVRSLQANPPSYLGRRKGSHIHDFSEACNILTC